MAFMGFWLNSTPTSEHEIYIPNTMLFMAFIKAFIWLHFLQEKLLKHWKFVLDETLVNNQFAYFLKILFFPHTTRYISSRLNCNVLIAQIEYQRHKQTRKNFFYLNIFQITIIKTKCFNQNNWYLTTTQEIEWRKIKLNKLNSIRPPIAMNNIYLMKSSLLYRRRR